jgi:hypothetical protein
MPSPNKSDTRVERVLQPNGKIEKQRRTLRFVKETTAELYAQFKESQEGQDIKMGVKIFSSRRPLYVQALAVCTGSHHPNEILLLRLLQKLHELRSCMNAVQVAMHSH